MTIRKYILTDDDVEDSLTSTSRELPLSANQGRVLNISKVDKNQGTAQAGKVLGIGADGLVYPMSAGAGAHASTHGNSGTDRVTIDASQVTSGTFDTNRIPTLTKSKILDFPTTMPPTAHAHTASEITSGTISPSQLPAATTSKVGAVKVGSGLSVDSDGTISTSGESEYYRCVSDYRVAWVDETPYLVAGNTGLYMVKVTFPGRTIGRLGIYAFTSASYTIHYGDGSYGSGEITPVGEKMEGTVRFDESTEGAYAVSILIHANRPMFNRFTIER